MQPIKYHAVAVGVCMGLSIWSAAPAVSGEWPAEPAAKGRAITAESIRRDEGFGDTKSTMTMTLTSENNEVSQRELRISVLETSVSGQGDKSLIVFDTPKDVQGTVLLTHTSIASDDDQWIFLPSVARTKRISGANKSGSFLGSEFAYEDLASQELDKYDYVWLRDEACPAPDQARSCYVVERTPRDRNSGYKRQVAWIDGQDFLLRKVEFFNVQDRLMKTLALTGYRKYGSYWRPHSYQMRNHLTGRGTELKVQDVRFKSGLTAIDFTEQAMERQR